MIESIDFSHTGLPLPLLRKPSGHTEAENDHCFLFYTLPKLKYGDEINTGWWYRRGYVLLLTTYKLSKR